MVFFFLPFQNLLYYFIIPHHLRNTIMRPVYGSDILPIIIILLILVWLFRSMFVLNVEIKAYLPEARYQRHGQ